MKGVPSETPKLLQKKGFRSWSRRHRAWLLLGIVLLCLSVMVVLLRLEDSSKILPNSPRRVSTSSGRTGTRSPLPIPTIGATTQTVTPSLYTVSSTNVGLMQPAVDRQGNVWVGEMATNRLCRLNSHTGEVTTWQPPDARFGIMMTAIDPSGNVWFVEQNANYIGRFDPGQQTFHTFPLGRVHGHPLGPQTLLFDASGSLWFTAVAGSIGRLNPLTGAIQTWPTADVSPFSLTVTSDEQVWFGNFTKGVGHLDPHTGHVTLFHLADEKAIVFSMAHDTKGHIWFTELSQGKLGMIDTTTNKITELQVPAPPGTVNSLYAITVSQNNDIWFANSWGNALVRYSPDHAAYTIFQLSTSLSQPYGLAIDSAGMLWFTATASSSIGKVIP